jgi:PhnB protein
MDTKFLWPIADQFHGDRGGKFEGPSGHRWWIAIHNEYIPPEEVKNRAAALFGVVAS